MIEVFILTYIDKIDNFYNDKNCHNSDRKNIRRIVVLEDAFRKYCHEKKMTMDNVVGSNSDEYSDDSM